MKRSRIWILVLTSSFFSGVFLGVIFFLSFNNTTTSYVESGNETYSDETGDAIVIIPNQETERETAETAKTAEIAETVKGEDFSNYFGTYVPKYGQNLMVDLGEDGEKLSRPHLISSGALLYIDKVKRGEDGVSLMGSMDYFGLHQWISLDALNQISRTDYSIHIGDECTICENWLEIPLYQEPQKDSVAYDVSLKLGDELPIFEIQNGYIETRTSDGVYGWVDGDYVTKFYTEFPYQMMYSDSNNIHEIPFYYDFPGSADVALGDPDGSIGDGSVLWFQKFSDGWGYAVMGDTGIWVNMTNAMPVSQTKQQKVIAYKTYEKESVGRTDFYKDGTAVNIDEYILPEAQYRYLEDNDLNALTLKGISYAKNELYAKYGRKFESQELSDYMATKSWYTPKYEPRTYDSEIVNRMNEYERKNIAILNAQEDALGPYEYDKN